MGLSLLEPFMIEKGLKTNPTWTARDSDITADTLPISFQNTK